MTNDLIDRYDAGLLGDGGGGNVEWWQDYIRAELDRAENFYSEQFTAALEAREAEITRYRSELTKIHKLVPGHIAGEIAWAALTGKDEAS